MSIRRLATLYATTVEVTCPFCGGCIESPDGSLFWTLYEVEQRYKDPTTRDIDCPECDEPIRISTRESAKFNWSVP